MSEIVYKRHISFKVIDCCVDCVNFTHYGRNPFCIGANKYIEKLHPVPSWCPLRSCKRTGELIDPDDEFVENDYEEDIRRIKI